MIAVIHIKLYSVPGKSPCIFHHILHTVHHYFCADWDKGIAGIHGYRMVSRRINTACRRTAGPLPAADGATAVSAGYNLSQRFSHPYHLCFRHSFPGTFRSNAVLELKDFLNLVFYLFIGKLPVFCRKIGDQVVRIV